MVSAVSYTRLTLALDIVKKIGDGPYVGYHELGIIKQRISLGDTITITNAETMGISCNRPEVPLDQHNICWKAVEIVQRESGIRDMVHVDINKVIPVQGGLAGGSTNAATVLNLLDSLWSLGISFEDKVRMGRELGMDVPFYFTSGSAFDSEATGVLEEFSHDMKLYFLLVVPPFGVSTADAYKNIKYDAVGKKCEKTFQLRDALMKKNYVELVSLIHNDFELSVFPQNPPLVAIRNQILQAGADASFMSGSGSTMVGVFSSLAKINEISHLFSNCMVVESL